MKLQSLNLGEIQVEEVEDAEMSFPKTFWKRQFYSEATKKQKIFDWIFGIILPVICCLADPIVFKGYGLGKGALLAAFKPFAYLLSFTSIIAMMALLIWGSKLKWLNSFLAGLFATSSLISLVIGIFLLPLSLIGIFFVIGILGFIPLFSTFVYLRNSLRAFQSAKPFFIKSALFGSFVFSVIISFTIPMLINLRIHNILNEMNRGNAATIKSNAQKLKYIYPLVNFDIFGGHYCESPDSEEHQALAEVYERFTGESIERIDFHICNDW